MRSNGSFVISESQYNAAKQYALENPERELFSGITAADYGNYIQYNVNSIYKVVDKDGNEVSIADSDSSDGVMTSIVTSRTN